MSIELFENGAEQEKEFDKEQWRRQLKERRDAYNQKVDAETERMLADPQEYRAFLDVAARFEGRSTGNLIAITAQMPDASALKTYDGWKELGVAVKKGAVGVKLNSKTGEHIGHDGKVRPSFSIVSEFDVSQTNFQQDDRAPRNANHQRFVNSLRKICPCGTAPHELTPGSRGALYWEDDNIIFLDPGQADRDELGFIQSFTKEMAKAFSEEEMSESRAQSIAYIVCKKFNLADGMETPIPLFDKTETGKDRLAALNGIAAPAAEMLKKLHEVYRERKVSEKADSQAH